MGRIALDPGLCGRPLNAILNGNLNAEKEFADEDPVMIGRERSTPQREPKRRSSVR